MRYLGLFSFCFLTCCFTDFGGLVFDRDIDSGIDVPDADADVDKDGNFGDMREAGDGNDSSVDSATTDTFLDGTDGRIDSHVAGREAGTEGGTGEGDGSGGDSQDDSGSDAAADSASDAAPDSGNDAAADLGNDAAADSGNDAAEDAGKDAGPTCPVNHICATVVLPLDFVGTPQRMALVLYNEEPDLLNDGVPVPDIRYGVVATGELEAGGSQELTQDFTSPVGGGTFTDGSYYVGILVFTSSQTQVPEDGIDYWFVTPTAEVLASGLSLHMGRVDVGLVPMLDDPNTVGNDLPGYVNCGTVGPCDLSANVCCMRVDLADYCEPAPECVGVPIAFAVECDGPEDCEGDEVCCGSLYDPPTCRPPDSCGPRDVICHVAEDCGGGACQAFSDAEQSVIDSGDYFTRCDVDDPSTIGDDRAGWIACDAEVCDLASQYCCNSMSDLNCVDRDAGQCGTISAQQHMCDGPEDCVGSEKCCSGEEGWRCRDSGSCFGAPACHTDDDCSIASGESCVDGRCVT